MTTNPLAMIAAAERLESRIGQDFDGECHLAEHEAREAAALLRSAAEELKGMREAKPKEREVLIPEEEWTDKFGTHWEARKIASDGQVLRYRVTKPETGWGDLRERGREELARAALSGGGDAAPSS